VENEVKAYPKIKNAVLLCLLFLGVQLLSGVVAGIIFGLFGISNESLTYGISITVLYLLSFSLVIFIGFKKSKQKFNEVFKFNKVSLDHWLAIIILMFGFIIVSSEIDNIINYLIPMPGVLQNIFETIIVDQMYIISIILVGILPAFAEEMFFRGVLLNGFKKKLF